MSLLYQPGKIASIETRNRFVASATVECLATGDNHLSEKYFKVYERLARGGAGLIIPGNYFVNPAGRAVDKVMVIDNDGVIDDLRKLAAIVHLHGAMIVGQINHGGRQCPPELIGKKPVAPSAVRDSLTGVQPEVLSEDEILAIIDDFGGAARRVQAAGFDGVQINGGHGYLVNQFLSPHTNRRNDRWGGMLENRLRFLAGIYRSIRDQVGEHFPVLIKMNASDEIPGGITLEESVIMGKRFEEMGFAALEISGGMKETGFATTRGDVPHDLILKNLGPVKRFLYPFVKGKLEKIARFSEGYYLEEAERIRQNVSIPVMAVGGMRRRDTMERALARGQADFIGLSRPFIRQPNLVAAMEKNPLSDVITCINCNRCTYEITVNYKPLRCYYPAKK